MWAPLGRGALIQTSEGAGHPRSPSNRRCSGRGFAPPLNGSIVARTSKQMTAIPWVPEASA